MLPENLQKEQDLLVEAFLRCEMDISPMDYIYRYGSKELKAFMDKQRQERKENERRGLVVD